MARIGDIELLDANALCGGAFLTTRPIPVSFERNGSDVAVEARKGARWVVIRSRKAFTPSTLLASVLGEAQVALDLVGRDGHFVDLDAPHTDHLLWWEEVSATCYEALLDPTGYAKLDFVLGLHMTQPGIAWTALPPV